MAKEPEQQATKICSSCGLPKPLSAFSQMVGLHGTIYGTICVSCRKAHADELKNKKADDGGTTSKTGKSVDAKAKVKGDIDKKQLRENVEEEYYKEREEEAELIIQLDEKKGKLTQDDRIKQEKAQDKKAIAEKNPTETELSPTEELAAREPDVNSTDATKDTYIPKLKYNSEHFSKFRQLLGKSSAMSQNVDTAVDILKKAGEPIPTKMDTDAQVDFSQKSWKPGSKR